MSSLSERSNYGDSQWIQGHSHQLFEEELQRESKLIEVAIGRDRPEQKRGHYRSPSKPYFSYGYSRI